jgi:hypothetical protein
VKSGKRGQGPFWAFVPEMAVDLEMNLLMVRDGIFIVREEREEATSPLILFKRLTPSSSYLAK